MITAEAIRTHICAKAMAPPGGWTAEAFAMRGVAFLRALYRSARTVQAAASSPLAARLRKALNDQTDAVIDRALRKSGHKAPVIIDPGAHHALWAEALREVLGESDYGVQVELVDMAGKVGGTAYQMTSEMLGLPDMASEYNRRVAETARARIASRVTRINDSTRTKMRGVIADAVGEGKTVTETADAIRSKMQGFTDFRVRCIARTETMWAWTQSSVSALKDSGQVTHVSVIGCEAAEPGSPTYKGRSTCNIEDVPIEDADKLDFHPNHTGCVVPSGFRDASGQDANIGTGLPVVEKPAIDEAPPAQPEQTKPNPMVDVDPIVRSRISGLKKDLHQKCEDTLKREAATDKLSVIQYKTALSEELARHCGESKVCSRVPTRILESIAKDGRLKTQFETGTSEGSLDHDFRKRVESEVFGTPTDIEDKRRPFYGYLTKNPMKDDASSMCYGDAVITFRDTVRPRSTFVIGDSFGSIGNVQHGTPVNAPSYHSVRADYATPVGTHLSALRSDKVAPDRGSYWEVQIHEGVALDEVESISWPVAKKMPRGEELERLRAAFAKHGVVLKGPK